MLLVAIHVIVWTMARRGDRASLFVDVFLGGWVGSGVAALIMWLLGGFSTGIGLGEGTLILVVLNVLPQVVGGFVSSALVTRKRREYSLGACLWTSVCAILIWVLITGHVSLYTVVGFLIGGYTRYVLARRASLLGGE